MSKNGEPVRKGARMNRNGEDRRVQRTRGLLIGALLELMREKVFEDVTIQEITERANVGRSTFYMHFEGKEDLLLSGFESLKGAIGEMTAGGQGGVLGFTGPFFAHLHEQQAIFRAMVGRKSGGLVQQGIQLVMTDLARDDLARHVPAREARGIRFQLAVQSAVGAFAAMLPWWLSQPKPLPPDQMNQLYRDLVIPGLRQVLGLPPGP